jgi:hypothetical protein
VILLMSGLPVVLLRPFQDTPFIDDWTYAWSVEHLLRTGQLKILDWSVSVNVVHVLWGALFCVPFGFSFTALRVSTWVASLLALVGLYVLMREVGARRTDALLGVGVVAFYPVYFILSFSFMTDVPFVALMVWSFAMLARAIVRGSGEALVAAVVLACLATAVRPVGVLLSGALLLAPWPRATGWRRPASRLAAAAAPVLAAGLLALARPALDEHRADLTWVSGSWAWRTVTFPSGLDQLPWWLVLNLTVAVGALGIALIPLALGGLSRENARVALPAGLAGGAVLAAELWRRHGAGAPLDPEFIWSLRELGATEALVPPLATGPHRVLGWAVGSMVLASLSLAFALTPLVRRRPSGAVSALAWGALGYFAMGTLLWLFYDRYALPLVVMVAALRMGTVGAPRRRLAVAGLALLLAVSLVGTWDHLRYNRAVWAAVAWARQAGIAPGQLDGGYVVNGWLEYAHPEHATRGPKGDVQVPGVNGGAPRRYGIVKVVPPGGQVLRAVPYRRLMAPSGRIYVVDRTP